MQHALGPRRDRVHPVRGVPVLEEALEEHARDPVTEEEQVKHRTSMATASSTAHRGHRMVTAAPGMADFSGTDGLDAREPELSRPALRPAAARDQARLSAGSPVERPEDHAVHHTVAVRSEGVPPQTIDDGDGGGPRQADWHIERQRVARALGRLAARQVEDGDAGGHDRPGRCADAPAGVSSTAALRRPSVAEASTSTAAQMTKLPTIKIAIVG